MSWLNLNQSLNSLKGQITNFATEVLSEGPVQDSGDTSSGTETSVKELQEKCLTQESEIASLKRLNEELQATLQSERLSRKNGVREEESSWYWDPPAQTAGHERDNENLYQAQIRGLQEEISSLKDRDLDQRPDVEEELHRLREENKNLTMNLEDLDNQHQMAMEKLLTLKKELQKNFEVLKQEHEELKSSNDQYALEVQSLLNVVGERDKEIEALKNVKADHDTLHHKYLNLEKIHSLLKENAENFQEENQELHEEIFKLQEQVTKLEHEIEISTKHSELSNSVPREKYEELLKELNDLKDRRNSNQVHLDEVNIDDNAKSVIENLKRDINELRHKLSQKEIDTQEHADSKFLKTDKIMQMYNKYVNFEIPIDYIGEMPSSDVNIFLHKLETVFKTVNSFKKDIDVLEHKLSEKNHNINHLKTQIDDLTTENDFLTTDIQHYETELNEMKKNNDFLIAEIAALKNTSKLEPIIETHEDNLAKLETELDNCNRINKNFEADIKKIEKELAEVRMEKVDLQESLNDLKNKYTSMLNELESFQTRTKAVEELEHSTQNKNKEDYRKASHEIDDLKKRLIAAQTKNEQQSIDIHIIENDKVLLTKEVDELKIALEEKMLSHKELTSQKEAMHQQLQDLERKLNETLNQKTEIKTEKSNFENNTAANVELQKIAEEKAKVSEKLGQTIQENSTLLETVEKLNTDLTNLRKTHQDLLAENSTLKNSSQNENKNIAELHRTIEELKGNITEQDTLKNEIKSLKEDKHTILERKLQLEAELSSTDSKIVHLEAEFEKLILDLNEKDTIIDKLNATIAQNNNSLNNLNQNISDLTNSVEIKNQEINRLTQSLQEVTQQFEDMNIKTNRSVDELRRLQTEKEEFSNQIFNQNEELVAKNIEISKLTNRSEELEKNCTEYKTLVDNKDKEIKELNQSIVELADKIKITDNTTHQNDEYAKLVQEKETIEKQVEDLKNNVTTKEEKIAEITVNCEKLEKACLEYKTILDNATKEKNELINLVNLKHNESVQYHTEIQRLNQVLLEKTNEFKKVIEEKDALLQNVSNNCTHCENLRITLKEKDEIIMTLNQNLTECEKMKADLLNASDTVKSLKERCENLDKSLAIQLEAVKRLTAENSQLSEQEQNSTRELERLRHHLVELEENYTQELMTSEQKLTECQTRLHQVEERAKQTSTVYTSNSIRANQEVETLRNQIKLLEKQREDVQMRLSDAEDARIRSEAALTNLQVVLEQFQLDKERDIQTATEKIRRKCEEQKQQNTILLEDIGRLNKKLEESLAGLQAASRLGDQVETKTAQINDLKEQVRTLQTSVAAAEERYYNAISNQQDKVDKNLVKNLVINYVQTATHNSQNKTQVLRILSTVLDFNQQECERLGLVRAAAPDSLAAEFVKFLQNESKPRAVLPNMMGLTHNSSRSTTPVSRRSSTLGPQPTFEAGHQRNTSTGSNNLLFQNIDALETSSQISIESDPRTETPRVVGMDTGVNQTRNTEGAILKYVLKDM